MTLRRFHLFELEDLTWFPRTIRDLATDYLHFMETQFALHRPIVPLLRRGLEQSGSTRIVDVCSGGGGPVLALYEALTAEGVAVQVTLTDKYPNLAAFRSLAARHPTGISYVSEPVDATRVPPRLLGFRTMFNAFHHFDPAAARAVLQNAVDAGQPIGIYEIPERTPGLMIPLLITPLLVVVATPFIRPFRWRRLLWTYLLPLVPLTCWWDGLVSILRAYTVAELKTMALELAHNDYEWESGRVRIPASPGHVTYLVGFKAPRAASAPASLPTIPS